MAKKAASPEDFARPVRRLLVGLLVVLLLAIFLFWRIDSPRAERIRAEIIDRVLPGFDWVFLPVTKSVEMLRGFQSYTALYEQNNELRQELHHAQLRLIHRLL